MQRVIEKTYKKGQKFLLLSDLHADNPKADLKYLKRMLDKAKQEEARILLNGDTFDLMGGKFDPRGNKDDLRPEHRNGKYFDSVINWMAELLMPYAHNIDMIGLGNHETSTLRHHETDVVERLVGILNAQTGSTIDKGGYKGWISYKVLFTDSEKDSTKRFNIHYIHGWGGGGPVTKGAIQMQRLDASTGTPDVVWQGHIHEVMYVQSVKEVININVSPPQIEGHTVHHVRTSTFKEEANTEAGYHVERGRPWKPLGGFWMTLNGVSVRENGSRKRIIQPEFVYTH